MGTSIISGQYMKRIIFVLGLEAIHMPFAFWSSTRSTYEINIVNFQDPYLKWKLLFFKCDNDLNMYIIMFSLFVFKGVCHIRSCTCIVPTLLLLNHIVRAGEKPAGSTLLPLWQKSQNKSRHKVRAPFKFYLSFMLLIVGRRIFTLNNKSNFTWFSFCLQTKFKV